MGYFQVAKKGVTWMGLFRVTFRAIGLARIAIIARLLTPYDLGVFAVATIALGFLEIITETGINIFLIQKRQEIDEYIDSAWVVSVVRGILIGLIISLTAQPISVFFNSPGSQNLILASSLIPIIRGFINPAIVKLQKSLDFKKEFFYRIAVFFVECAVSVTAAFITKSPSALVFGLITAALFEVLYTFFVVDLKPQFKYSSAKIKEILSRGKWVTLFGVFDYLYTTGDNIIVGRLLGVAPLGIYQNAYKISTTPITEVGDVFFRVTFPVFAKFSEDKERLKKAFLKNTLVNAVIMSAGSLIIFVFAEPIVKIMLGPGWEAAIPVTKLLCVLGVVRGIAASTNSLLVAREKQKYSAIIMMISSTGLLVTIIPLVQRFGIMGAAAAAITGSILSLPFTIYFISKTLR